MNEELKQYLYTMITPTQIGGESLVIEDLSTVDWASYQDEQYHGLIVLGEPTPAETEQIWRVIKPGAHVVMIAPDDAPLGYMGACNLEDQGFEIRDSIAILDTPGEFFYIPKPASRERHAGTEHLLSHRATYSLRDDVPEDVEIPELEKTTGLSAEDIPEGFEEYFVKSLTSTYGNSHPTVKGKAVMEACLKDIPKTSTVLDCFMGSGGTGIACLQTGHNFIGIERELEYLQIADARIKYWRDAEHGVKSVQITSEAPEIKVEIQDDTADMLDIF